MKIKVKVKTRKGEQKIVELGENKYLIYLKSEPKDNKANIELINLLSKYFSASPKNIKIKSGRSSRDKILEIK
jgi:hypothetical protein